MSRRPVTGSALRSLAQGHRRPCSDWTSFAPTSSPSFTLELGPPILAPLTDPHFLQVQVPPPEFLASPHLIP